MKFLHLAIVLVVVANCICEENSNTNLWRRIVQDYVDNSFSSFENQSQKQTSNNLTSVETSLGTVVGTEENGYRLFRGIPYASPPIGDKRWTSPTPPTGKMIRFFHSFCFNTFI